LLIKLFIDLRGVLDFCQQMGHGYFKQESSDFSLHPDL